MRPEPAQAGRRGAKPGEALYRSGPALKRFLHASTGGLEPLEPRALAGGYQGIRVSGNTAWLEQKHWRDFME